jgi:hypothetical protein
MKSQSPNESLETDCCGSGSIVMWFHKLALVLAALALFIAALDWHTAEGPRARVSMGILSYRTSDNGPVLPVFLGLTNTGPTTIRCDSSFLSGGAWVRVELPGGWAVRALNPIAMVSLLPDLLRPGSNTSATVLLPPDALRWQVVYRVRTASLRDRVLSRLGSKWRNRLYPLCQRLLSAKEGPEQEMRSSVFECPLSARSLDGGRTSSLFDSNNLLPFGTPSRSSTCLGPNAF